MFDIFDRTRERIEFYIENSVVQRTTVNRSIEDRFFSAYLIKSNNVC